MEDVATLAEVLKDDIGDLDKEVGLLKQAVSNTFRAEDELSKVKVLEPKAYNGTWNVKELENFLWDVEQYIRATPMPEVERVTITSMYLKGDAKLQWLSRFKRTLKCNNRRQKHETPKRKLKGQFCCANLIVLTST